ncbi:UrcA family protein [Sandaracinobacteroides saxicola]|uniref:UrcA family protein n=1 Tax=Sandaracinobacteroides saxicola TaxID=2759707 RepID=A0A7G5II58_9SPHN|nr:UrcA family protein [Sandaracinobacteroides saxicola]QMW23050.1 UrcA family protein [Sandaracinobacteroides saxicola]
MTSFKMMIAAVAAFGAFAAVQAEGVRSVNVETADLNLASARGVAELHGRIGVAVKAVCGKADGRDLNATADVARCRAESLRAAMQWADAVVARQGATVIASR